MQTNLKHELLLIWKSTVRIHIHKQTNKQDSAVAGEKIIKFNRIVLFFSYFYVYYLYFKKHQSECLFKVVKCPNSGCAMMLSKRDMKTHEISECSWRKVNCEYCQESVIVNQKQV